MDHKWDTLVNQYIPLRKLTKKEIKNRFKAWITSGIHWLINTFRLENLPRKKLKTDSKQWITSGIHWLINTFRLENLPRKKLKTDSKHGSQVGYTG